MNNYRTNVVIVGGGIAGLVLLHELTLAGYSAVLLESQALGAGQTICSQGIIHSGVKYALLGKLTDASQALATMPARWQAYLSQHLSSTTVLSNTQLLWSTGSLSTKFSAFLASKSLRSRAKRLSTEDFPAPFNHPAFRGSLYELNEPVLDVHSLISALAKSDKIFKYEEQQARWDTQGVSLPHCRISADKIVLLAGKHNETLMQHFSIHTIQQQLRPLHMSYLTMPGLPLLYAHCMQNNTKPRITITSHTVDERVVWYLGGDLAETGVQRNQEQQNAFVKAELNTLMPWLDFSAARIDSFRIDRAEASQSLGQRPNAPILHQEGNIMVGWPTKLAFAPLLADNIIHTLSSIPKLPACTIDELAKPSIAVLPWRTMCNNVE